MSLNDATETRICTLSIYIDILIYNVHCSVYSNVYLDRYIDIEQKATDYVNVRKRGVCCEYSILKNIVFIVIMQYLFIK